MNADQIVGAFLIGVGILAVALLLIGLVAGAVAEFLQRREREER